VAGIASYLGRVGLAVEVSGAGGGRVVLVHGFTQTGRSWATLAADLGRNHTVVTPDLPGHGGSATLEADLPGAAALLGDAGARAVYVGYSLGGRVCLHLALDRPDLVQALVLLGATPGIEDPAERAARRAADEARADHLEAVGVAAFLDEWLAQPLFARLPRDAAALDDRLRNTAAGLASSLRLAGTGTQAWLLPRLGTLSMPSLFLAGEHDERFRAEAERMAAAAPHGATAVIPGAGHAAHLERPEVFLALLRAFLAGQGFR